MPRSNANFGIGTLASPAPRVLHGVLLSFWASVSIAQCSAVTPRVRTSFQEALFAIDADDARVAHVVVPVGDHLHRLSSAFQFTHDLVGDAPFERHVARARAPGAAHQPARRFYCLLDVVTEIDDAGDQRGLRLRLT